MSDELVFRYDVNGDDFTSAGQASITVKKNLRQLGISPEIIRRVSIAMYEGEINMVIHAGGGTAEVRVSEDCITIILEDKGPGFPQFAAASRHGRACRWIHRGRGCRQDGTGDPPPGSRRDIVCDMHSLRTFRYEPARRRSGY